jgi:SAM-dependent methyltransferase
MFLTKCRMCWGGSLYKFLDLGETPPADQFLFAEQLAQPEPKYPLQVVLCDDCGLIQLNYEVPADVLYCKDYPYESSTTAAGRKHWNEFAETTVRTLSLKPDDLVVDVGSNVGVLLQMFKGHGMRVLGVDPAANIAEIANRNGIETIASFFNVEGAKRIVASKGHAAVATGTNVFAHIGNLHDLMQAIDILLDPDGVFIIEAPYAVELIQNLEYDTIYHEHLSYLSLKPMQRFFAQFGFEIFEVQRRDIHGGSFRVFVRRQNSSKFPISGVILELLASEDRAGIHDHKTLTNFAAAVEKNRRDLRELLSTLKRSGKRIAGVSAPAKGMTLLNYCGLTKDMLDFVTEKSKLKIGRYTPGQHIPIVSDDVLTEQMPDYALLLAWNFAEEIMGNLKAFSDRGGKFIIPIPIPKIVG